MKEDAEVLAEVYGTVWYLAEQLVEARSPGRRAERHEIVAVIEEATEHHQEGVTRGRSGS